MTNKQYTIDTEGKDELFTKNDNIFFPKKQCFLI